MKKILIFGGTAEGRELAEELGQKGADVTVCVVSDYGAELLEPADNLHVHVKAMTKEEIVDYLTKGGFYIVADATHPYARKATENISEACRLTETEYIRVVRPAQKLEGVEVFEDIVGLTDFLNKTEGNILLTTGSKDLEAFTVIKNYADRIFPRMLPSVESVQKAIDLRYKSKNLICMHGPFSVEMNVAILREINAGYLVTKDSAKAGGVPEKLEAAGIVGAKVLVIGRPVVESGLGLAKAKKILERLL